MSLIISLIIAFSIGFTGTPSQAPAQAPTQVAQAPSQAPSQAVCDEDMPCWDCATMGNKQCADPLTVDAWNTLDSAYIEAPVTQNGMMLSYVDSFTEAPKNVTAGSFTVQSATLPNVWHLFQWDTLHNA